MCISSHASSRKHKVTVRFTVHSLTPTHTTYLLAAKHHLIIKSPSLPHTHPYTHILIFPYTVLFKQMVFISLKCHTQYTAISGILYIYSNNLINSPIHMTNLATVRHMQRHCMNCTFPSHSALDFLVETHPKLNLWVHLHRIWGYMLREVGPMSYLKPNGRCSCWTTLSCIFQHYKPIQ